MARRRFFVAEFRNGHAAVCGEDAHHLARVLRVETGRRFELSDNRAVWLAEVESASKDRVEFTLIEELASAPAPLRLTLLASLIKFDRFEWMLEKATELGVERFVPVMAARSGKGLDRVAAARRARWERILVESSQQARRDRLPELGEVADLGRTLARPAGSRYLLDEERGAEPILAALPACRAPSDEVALLAGPEGGWTEAERDQAREAGWRPVSLGRRILRAETAALAAVAVLASAWEVGGIP